jgi:DNA-binding NarL/FixJ family response regulator
MESTAVQSTRSSSRGKKLLSLVPTVVVCESPLFRAGLFHSLAGSRYRVKADGSKLSDLSESVFGDQRCVALISLDGEPVDILSQVASLTARYSGLHVVALAERFCSRDLVAAIGAGADGYLLKNEISAAALVQSLDVVLLGGVVIPKGLTLTKPAQPLLDAVPAFHDPEDASERAHPQSAIDATQTGDMIAIVGEGTYDRDAFDGGRFQQANRARTQHRRGDRQGSRQESARQDPRQKPHASCHVGDELFPAEWPCGAAPS